MQPIFIKGIILSNTLMTPKIIHKIFCILMVVAISILCIIHFSQKKLEDIIYAKLVDLLLVHDVYDSKNQKLSIIRHGKKGDGGYVVPEVALETADTLLGYGISNDISFEERFSDKYQKPSYGFDCSIDKIDIKNKSCHFIQECISSTKFLSNQPDSNKLVVSSFPNHLQKLELEHKKIFLKMDIEGAEYDAFEDIYQYSNNITGIVLEIHFNSNIEQVIDAIKLLTRLDKDFYLIHLNANNCCYDTFTTPNSKGKISKVLELTFINKHLVHHAEISHDQSHPLQIDEINCPMIERFNFEIIAQNPAS